MTKQGWKTLRSGTLTIFFVLLCLAGIFSLVDFPGLARAAILSDLDYEVHCISLGGVAAGACDDAE